MAIDVATGKVELDFEDVSIPGKVDLTWERNYSTGLLNNPPSALGKGWTNRYFATLTRKPDGFEFITPQGTPELFVDSEGLVEGGGRVTNFGSFLEVFKMGGRYIVQSWDVESGEIWRYCFAADSSGQVLPLLCIEDVTGQGLDLIHDCRGRLVSIKQRLEQRALILEYGTNDRIQAVFLHGANGERHSVMRYEYDSGNQLSAVFNALDYADRYEYDREGRITRELGKDGSVFSYRYDKKGRCVWYYGLDYYDEKKLKFLDAIRMTELTDSYGATTQYQYLPDGQIVSVRNPLGAEAKTGYDEYGRIISKTTPTGATTKHEYDEQGNRNKIVDPLGSTSSITFNEHHLPTILIDPNSNTWKRHYDGNGRLTATIDPFEAQWGFEYDNQGNLITQRNPKGHARSFRYRNGILTEDIDWCGNSTHLEFDLFGHVIKETDPLGATIRYEYDPVGNLIRVFFPEGALVQAFYNANGDFVKVIDPVGRVTTRRFGTCGRLMEREDPNGNKVTYGWGTEPDRLEQVANESEEVYRFFYNELGYCTKEVSFDGRECRFAYDPSGLCIKTTNGTGETIEIGRDPLGRIISQTLPDGSAAKYDYDKLGNLIEAVNSGCAIRLERDIAGRLVREVQGEHWVKYTLDKLGEVSRMETDLGLRVDYDLDPNGFWKKLRTGEGHTIHFQRDTAGREIERQLPGGLSLTQHYDPLGRIIEQRLAPRGGGYNVSDWALPNVKALILRNYKRDASGLVQSIEDLNSGKTSYTYDPGERLLQVMRDRGPMERFEYDTTGNITRVFTNEQECVKDEGFKYGPGNRLLNKGSTQYKYDDQGRLVSKIENSDTDKPRIWLYQWDALDQLLSVIRPDGEVWCYSYDAFGRRLRKTGPSDEVRFVWNGDVIVHELSEYGKNCTNWIFEQHSFSPLAQIKKGDFYSVFTDHLGTPQEIADTYGRIVWRLQSKAYGGNFFEIAEDISCPFRFQGQYYDIESGLHYNMSRYFEPEVGRFITQDPIGITGGNNLYQYAPNPTGWVDPWGWEPWSPHGAAENDVISKGVHFNAGNQARTELKVVVGPNGEPAFARVFSSDPDREVEQAIRMANEKFNNDAGWRQRLLEAAGNVKKSLFENFGRRDKAREVKRVEKAIKKAIDKKKKCSS